MTGRSFWYGFERFCVEGLRTDSLVTPYIPLRVSQVVAAAAVIVSVILLIVFRNRTVLTGCGSSKIMELNSIADEVEQAPKKEESAEEADDGTSTIFENKEDAAKVLAGDSVQKDENSAGIAAQTENSGHEKDEEGPEKSDK